MKKLLVIHAGLSRPSSTEAVARDIADAVVAQVSKRGEGLEVEHVAILDYLQDVTTYFATGVLTSRLAALHEKISLSDAMVAATPVFSASYSGMFKMFFDTLDPKALVGKPVIIAATAGTPRHSLVLEHALRPLFAYLRAVIMPAAIFAATADFGEETDLNTRIVRAAGELAGYLVDTAAVVGFGPDFTPDREEVETGSPLFTSTSPFADLLRGHDGGGR